MMTTTTSETNLSTNHGQVGIGEQLIGGGNGYGALEAVEVGAMRLWGGAHGGGKRGAAGRLHHTGDSHGTRTRMCTGG